jgi:hypothetical protein
MSNQLGNCGTKGTTAASNQPGARSNPVVWKDASGSVWLSGGIGFDGAGNNRALNDLWKFNGSNWTWVSGSTTGDEIGTYGTKGMAAAANVPGARLGAASWTDNSGKLWLFGVLGYGANSSLGDLNVRRNRNAGFAVKQ